MATYGQLGSILGRKVPDYEEALIRGKLPYLTSYKSAQESREYQDASQALSRQALEQQQQNAWESLRMQREAQDEAKKQAKQSELMGWGNTAVTTGLGAMKYGGAIKEALGIGGDSLAAGAVGAPGAASFAPAIAGNVAAQQAGLGALSSGGTFAGGTSAGTVASGSLLGVPEAVSGTAATGAGEAASLGGLGWGGAAGAAGAGALGGALAANIGGGTSTKTKAAKGALGGAVAGAATGAALTSWSGPGAIAGGAIGGVVGAVTQVVGGGGGRVICTKLVEMGLLDPELHKSEAKWSLANKFKATVRGYHWWAVPFTKFMDGKPRLCRALAVMVRPYAKCLAYKAGSPLGKFNLFGLALDLIGSTACWCIGQFVKFDKYGPEWDREDAHREEVDVNA